MRYEIKVTAQAQEQLREIRDYITQELLSPEAARNTILLLTSAMETLAEMLARVRLMDGEPWHTWGIRMKAVGNFLIYFRIDEKNAVVQVIAVIYARRNQPQILSHLDFQ